MVKFKEQNLSSEEAFWVMWYCLKEHHDLSNNTFDVRDILSASEPIEYNELGHVDGETLGNRETAPIDQGMIGFWNSAIDKYNDQGKPPTKKFIKTVNNKK